MDAFIKTSQYNGFSKYNLSQWQTQSKDQFNRVEIGHERLERNAWLLHLGHEERVGFWQKRECGKAFHIKEADSTRARKDNKHMLFGIAQWMIRGREKCVENRVCSHFAYKGSWMPHEGTNWNVESETFLEEIILWQHNGESHQQVGEMIYVKGQLRENAEYQDSAFPFPHIFKLLFSLQSPLLCNGVFQRTWI